MAAPNGYGYGYQNGHNAPTSASNSRENRPMRRTPFTVDEALPYSPFSSVVPFNSGLRSSVPLFSTTAELEHGRQSLESLNTDATNTYQTPQRLERMLKDLQQLLRPEEHTK
ncbi:AT hook domain-containing protein [Rutstroemia sp. NJR-2017a WRK4]|nr:AT hook domain-containing protein [Rutstroemia sp. NJR-2017a WRK4]